MTSLLPVLRQAHNDNPWDDATLHALRVDGTQIGFIPPNVMEVAKAYLADRPHTHLRIQDGALTFAPEAIAAQRTDEMNQMAVWMRDTKKFPDPLDGRHPWLTTGWRDEQYAVYGPGDGENPSTVVFTLERSACALFGIATFGVHLTVRPMPSLRHTRPTAVFGSRAAPEPSRHGQATWTTQSLAESRRATRRVPLWCASASRRPACRATKSSHTSRYATRSH